MTVASQHFFYLSKLPQLGGLRESTLYIYVSCQVRDGNLDNTIYYNV